MQQSIDPVEYQQFLEFKQFQLLKSQVKSSASSMIVYDTENKENECLNSKSSAAKIPLEDATNKI